MTDSQRLPFDIHFPIQKVQLLLRWVVGLNIIFLFGTWLHHSQLLMTGNRSVQILLAQFNFALENVAAAWYSSMLFFSTGQVALLCFWADMQRSGSRNERVLNFGWIVMAGIFIMLSFDEMGSFHEMIGETAVFKSTGGSEGGGWYAFYALIALVALFMITFFVMKFKQNKTALLLTIVGVLLFVSNPFQEKFEISTWRQAADPSTWRRPVFFLLLEEGSEIFASFCFLYSFLTYAVTASSGNGSPATRSINLKAVAGRYVIFYLGALACVLGVVMLVIHENAWNFARDDNGIPNNWPPSATAFFCAVAAGYCYVSFDEPGQKKLYLLLAVTCLAISVYFGSNCYGYTAGIFSTVKYLLLLLSVVAAAAAMLRMERLPAKIFFAGFLLMMGASVFSHRFFPSAFGYLGMVFFLLGLYLQYADKRTRSANLVASP